MNKILFRGIMPALPTAFDKNEKLDKNAMRALVDHNLKGNVDGFYVCGATGEGPVLPAKVRMETLEAVMEANNGRGKIIAHVGGPEFNDVKKLIAHAEKCGVDAISSLAPNAYYPHSNDEIVKYYKKIASITSLPLIVYVTPLLLGNDLESIFCDLISVENIIGCKFTLPNYYLMTLIKMINGGNINVINGPDEMLLAGLSMGADGGIGSTYNIMPEKFVTVYKAFRSGDTELARKTQYEINKIIQVLIEGHHTIRNVKAALTLQGIDMGYPVFPYGELDKKDMEELKNKLILAGLEL